MKSFFLAALSCCLLCLLALFSCQKEADTTVIPDKDTTVIIKDTTTIVKDTLIPPVKGKKVIITVRETISGKPLSGKRIGLFSSYIVNYPSTYRVYNLKDWLGTTDEKGQLEWKWSGDSTLPARTYIGVAGEDNYQEIFQSPGDQYFFTLKATGAVRLRITLQKDSLPYKSVYLLERKASGYYTTGLEAYNVATSFKLTAPFDTTIVITQKAPYSNTFAIRYNVDDTSLQNYLSTGTIGAPFGLQFKPLDTVEAHVIIK
jgi:hypothetical protein